MRFAAVVSIIAISLTGCASVNKQAISSKSVSEIKNQTITYTARKKPDFAAMTAGKAAFAMLGAVAMISEGNSIIANNNVPDPADAIAVGIAKALENSHGARLVTPPIPAEADEASQIVARVNGGTRYVIDAQTINWSFVYFPTDWTHYRVIYTAKARLIDAMTKEVVAEGFCKHIPENSANAPTYDELLANQASRLKSELATAAGVCVQSLKTEMLAL